MQFHTDKDDEKAVVYFTKENSEEFAKIDSEKKPSSNGKGPDLVAKTDHFSQGFVGIPESDALDAGTGGPDGSVIVEDGSVPGDGGTEPDAALVPKHIVVLSKDAFGIAVNQTWAAYQDGDGAWQALAPSAVTGTYEFDITGSRYGVAFVCADTKAMESAGTLNYAPASASALEVTTSGAACTVGVAPAEFTLSGIADIDTSTYLRFGHANLNSGISSGGGQVSYGVSNLVNGVTTDILFGSSNAPDTSLRTVLFVRDVTLLKDRTDPRNLRGEERQGPSGLGQCRRHQRDRQH